MDTPTFNSEGMQVYKPQPGEYWKGGLRFRESYGGIIAEINDIIVKSGGPAGSYPQNFAGIIAALNDLGKYITEGDRPVVGPVPPDWEVIINPNTGEIGGDWIEEPPDGALWFDTRQGRLFVAVAGEYWQTNGADGLAHVGAQAPTNPPVIGSTWFDTVNEVLYVYVGKDDDGNGLWQIVKGAGDLALTTATLPLSIAKSRFSVYTPTVIPEVPIEQMGVQKDFNEYIYAAAIALDKAVTESTVTISDTPPIDNVVNGTLWYDSTTLELSVWYEDDDSAQWVPTSVNYTYDDDLTVIRASIVSETTAREYAVGQLLTQIEALRQGGIPDVDALETKVAALEDHVNNHPVEVDLTGYLTEAALQAKVSELTTHINTVNARIPSVEPYATSNALQELQTAVSALPSKGYVASAVSAAQPNLSAFVTQDDINTSISNITTEYLPRTGGTLTGSFVMNKQDVGLPGLDFSTAETDSRQAFKFVANDGYGASPVTTFGSNDNYWEFAHNFSSNEDFCWVYGDSNKVFSITKDGPACSQLYLADFQTNTTDGRVLTNKIDVKDRLQTYQSTFESLRQSVANATDFDELKANILTALANV
jgi:hypothetical protein